MTGGVLRTLLTFAFRSPHPQAFQVCYDVSACGENPCIHYGYTSCWVSDRRASNAGYLATNQGMSEPKVLVRHQPSAALHPSCT